MKKQRTLFMALIAFFAVVVLSATAYALPTLQLGIYDSATNTYVGDYDPTTETTVAETSPFVLRALWQDDGRISSIGPGDYFYISGALLPSMKEVNPGPDLGAFEFTDIDAATTLNVDVVDDMEWGNPPIDILPKNEDIAKHSIFPTYYIEYAFLFDQDAAHETGGINVETLATTSDTLYFKDFGVDLNGLAQDYTIHFDLYFVDYSSGGVEYFLVNGDGTYEVIAVAPFSHDVEGGAVPEPGTLLLLGTGLFGAVGWAHRKRRAISC